MRLSQLYVRFYRSFNFDYERKAHPNAKPESWEQIDGEGWFPFIRVQLDRHVTAIVGANESGKSHLLGALTAALDPTDLGRHDFCRYSALFSVEQGSMRVPDFALDLDLDDDDVEIADVLQLGAGQRTLTFVRLGNADPAILDQDRALRSLDPAQLAALEARLPKPFLLETNVPLPDSVSIAALLGRTRTPLHSRRLRSELTDFIAGFESYVPDAVIAQAQSISDILSRSDVADQEANLAASEALAIKLLKDVAQIDEAAFKDLEQALNKGQEGRVGGLIEQMNRSLARHLNFSRWWRQDRDFELRLAPRERELVFTIRDRTGTDYSFSERSRGLMYFLSYYVQLKAHQPTDGFEVLLMDEPDAFLSSAGQQDLLRTLEHFARPEDGSRPGQVVYVTHSPFLINRNAAHRIRVLDKGSDEEGTRVVRNAAQNHYEPLRSAIGAFVAETAFVGGSNLLVEGVADQVILAGMATYLRKQGVSPSQLLDLNEVTIVPAGSASSVPYMAYLARGRDEIRPACVALLDGDAAGRAAIKKLERGEVNGKQLLPPSCILDLGSWAEKALPKLDPGVSAVEIEDLIPISIACKAAHAYARKMLGATAPGFDDKAVTAALHSSSGQLWKAIATCFADGYDGAHIDKVGFAKELIEIVDAAADTQSGSAGLPALRDNFKQLIADLTAKLATAEQAERDKRQSKRLNRAVVAFNQDHPTGSTRDDASQVLRDIDNGLDGAAGDDRTRQIISDMRRRHALDTDPLEAVADFTQFKDDLNTLLYQERLAHQPPEPATVAPKKKRTAKPAKPGPATTEPTTSGE